MKWINLIGLVLQFLAFWLAAPELLGKEALERFEKGLISFVSGIPSIIMGIAGIGFGIGLSVFGILKGLEASDSNPDDIKRTMIFIAVVSVLLLVYFLVFARRTQRWMKRRIAVPLLKNLIENNESRKQALIMAAVLFSIGFLLQAIVIALA